MEIQNADVESVLEPEPEDVEKKTQETAEESRERKTEDGGLETQPGDSEEKTGGERREQNTEVKTGCCSRKCCGINCSPRRWVAVGVAVVVVIVAVPLLCYFLRPTSVTPTSVTVEDIENQLKNLTDRQVKGSYPTTEEDFARRKDVFEKFLGRVESMSTSHWSEDDVLRLDILKTYVQTFVDGHDWWDYGNFVPFPIIGESLPDGCDSLEGLAEMIDWKITLMKRGLMLNRTAHNLTVKQELTGLSKLLNNCSDKTAIAKLTKMVSFLEHEYIPHVRTTPGVYSWPNGLAYYNACLSWHLGHDIGPQKLHDQSNSDVTRIKGQMQKLLQNFQFSGTIGEYKEYTETKQEFHPFSNEKKLFGALRNLSNSVQSKLPTLFRRDVVIKPPEFISENKEGTYISYWDSIVYVNTTNTSSFNKHDIVPIILHEVYPGHHYHLRYKESVPDQAYTPPDYMSYANAFAIPMAFPYFTSFLEGWGLYAEFLGVELGILDNPHDRFAAYQTELWRAGRIVYDTGINAFGWTVQDAKTFIASIGLSDAIADVEILRAVNRPGEVCSYKTGEKYLKKLRAQAKMELGSLFDIREFHHAVLNTGVAPLTVVKKSVNLWIRRKLKAAGKT